MDNMAIRISPRRAARAASVSHVCKLVGYQGKVQTPTRKERGGLVEISFPWVRLTRRSIEESIPSDWIAPGGGSSGFASSTRSYPVTLSDSPSSVAVVV